jgi:hypothetical protein
MLPIDLKGTELNRAKGLPPLEARFVEPDSGDFGKEWKPDEA